MHFKIVNIKNRHCRLPCQQKMALFGNNRTVVLDREAEAKPSARNKREAGSFKHQRAKLGGLLGSKSPREETGNSAIGRGGGEGGKPLVEWDPPARSMPVESSPALPVGSAIGS